MVICAEPASPHSRSSDRDLLPVRLRPEIRNRLVMLGALIAAELPAHSDGNRRWIGVWVVPPRHPLDPKPPAPGAFRVRQFEVPATLLSDDYSPYDGDFVDVVDEWADSIGDVEELIGRYVDPSQMDVPWKCDFPL